MPLQTASRLEMLNAAAVPEADPQSVTSAARGSSPEVAPHKLRLSHALARLLFR